MRDNDNSGKGDNGLAWSDMNRKDFVVRPF